MRPDGGRAIGRQRSATPSRPPQPLRWRDSRRATPDPRPAERAWSGDKAEERTHLRFRQRRTIRKGGGCKEQGDSESDRGRDADEQEIAEVKSRRETRAAE